MPKGYSDASRGFRYLNLIDPMETKVKISPNNLQQSGHSWHQFDVQQGYNYQLNVFVSVCIYTSNGKRPVTLACHYVLSCHCPILNVLVMLSLSSHIEWTFQLRQCYLNGILSFSQTAVQSQGCQVARRFTSVDSKMHLLRRLIA